MFSIWRKRREDKRDKELIITAKIIPDYKKDRRITWQKIYQRKIFKNYMG